MVQDQALNFWDASTLFMCLDDGQAEKLNLKVSFLIDNVLLVVFVDLFVLIFVEVLTHGPKPRM